MADVHLLHAAGDLVLGTACVGCGRPGPACCTRCEVGLVAAPRRLADLPGPTAAVSSLPYAGVVREAVVAYKERRVLALGRPLARCLAAAVVLAVDVAGVADDPLVLVPVPSRPSVVRQRGHDAIADLARASARLLRRTGVPARAAPCLAQRRGVRDQVGLAAAERHANLDGALRVRGRPPVGGTVVVVDDVLTTGASAAAAVSALAGQGLAVAAVAVVAG